ncbi:DegT/DnrJ/EryC1/StrS aminotransferase family protein, partial [Candidatus Parcubacteria bacterium]|nr:DegT/DnrJ/EryC1/StrS aminotransferase family protein [Candidatus Parcubacteria bacterium]
YHEALNKNVYAQYTIAFDKRDELRDFLNEKGIPTAIHYPIPLHKQPAFLSDDCCPKAEHAANRVLSLPMSPYLTQQEQDEVVGAIDAFLDVNVE